MFAEFSLAHKSLFVRVLACLLCVALTVALCPLQGWSDEPALVPAPGQLTKIVPIEEEPETPQLMKSVPMADDSAVPQLTKAVPLASEPEPSKAPEETKPAKVIFVISEPTATWPDSTTDDIIVEVPIGECLGDLVPPSPISSDESLVFEGWQTEDFETIDEEALRKRTIEGDAILYAVFSLKSAGGEQRAEPVELIARGTFGTCNWAIRGTSTTGTLTINAGTLGDFEPSWTSYADRITSVVVNQGVKMGEYTDSLFFGCYMLTSITGLNNLDTSHATSMQNMFSGCEVLVSLDLSSWDVSNVTDMNNMFYGCVSLESMGDLSKWNTASVTNMDSMFSDCNVLVSLNLSSWDVSNVTDMNCMFTACFDLKSMGDLSKWNTSNVTNMNGMFCGCEVLVSLNLSSWDVSNVMDMNSMFAICPSLESMGDLSKWNTASVTNMGSMFDDSPNLTSLDLSSWNTSNVTRMEYMFSRCNSLKEIPASLTLGATTEANRTDIFKVTSGGPVVTTYNGSDADVKNYDWPSAGRALKNTPLTGSVTLSGDASSVEQTLTALAEPDNACRNVQQVFTWYRGTSATDSNPTQIASGTSYTTTNADAGKYIICKMTDGLGAYTGEISKAVGPVKRTFSGTVSLEGTTKVGSTLTANVNNPSSGQVAFTYKWYRSSTGTDAGELISGETSNSYALKEADKGMFVSCEVSVADTTAWTGSIRSGWSARVLKDFSGTVSIDGSMLTGSKLTANVSGNAGSEILSYRWYRSDSNSGDGEAISGATTSTYEQTDADRNKYLSCVVSVANTTAWTGSIRSGWKGPSLTTFAAGVSLSGTAVVGKPPQGKRYHSQRLVVLFQMAACGQGYCQLG